MPILAINADNVDEVNRTLMKDGYRFNPDSFRPLTVRGVRLIEVPSAFDEKLSENEPLVVGYRNHPEESFQPVYSMRDFVLWLHRYADDPDFAQLLDLRK